MKFVQPILVICLGLLLTSIGFNILLWQSNRALVYEIQKLEAGPARGLFDKSDLNHSTIGDEEHSRIINELLKQMIEQQKRNNII